MRLLKINMIIITMLLASTAQAHSQTEVNSGFFHGLLHVDRLLESAPVLLIVIASLVLLVVKKRLQVKRELIRESSKNDH